MTATEIPALTVSEVTAQLKDLVEANFPAAAVVGEISNLTRASSGHVYFTLKDDACQLRAVMWRSTAVRVRFELHDGLEVVAVGPVQIYPARGTYQLMVEQLVPVGLGALELAFRQLQEKLAREGLFAPERKRPIPRFPRRIALVTSPSSAAVRDLLQVITRRWPAVDVVVVPVPVQGEGAAARIASALRTVHRIPRVDVVITGRGGGSPEDLWAFNEEIVARAVYDCRLPVICAVGHEIDLSIADLVADRRALTPSEAGELAVPLLEEVLAELRHLRDRLAASLRERAHRARLQLDALASRRVVARPREAIRDRAQRLDELEVRLCRAIRQRVRHDRRMLESAACSLDALSPLKVLQRGYSITQRAESGEVIRSGAQLAPGETITTLTSDARVTSRVESVEKPHF